MRFAAFLPLLCAGSLMANSARAQSPRDKAEELFQQGRKLIQEGQFAAGCEKLAASQELDPATGTLLNLAECYEKAGHPAQALRTYERAKESAERQGRADWAKFAGDRVTAIAPHVPRARLHVDKGAGLAVELDGKALGNFVSGGELRVDPGPHRVVLREGKREVVSRTFTIAEGASDDWRIDAPTSAPSDRSIAPPPVTSDSGVKTSVWIVGGLGVASLAFGGAMLAVRALQVGAMRDRCRMGITQAEVVDCDARAAAVDRSAVTSGVAFGLGGAMLAAALVLHFTGAKDDATGKVALCAPELTGVSCFGRF